jgi:hypothetical protein
MKRIMVVAGVVTLALAGCSGGGGGTAKDVDYESASAIAKALNTNGFTCSGWTPNTEVVGAREDGSCDHNGETVTVTVFQDADQMKKINDAFKDLASGVSVRGKAWQVGVTDKTEAEQVKKILGGDIN